MFSFLSTILAASALAATNAVPIRSVADALSLSAFDGLGPWPFVLEGQLYSTNKSSCNFKDATGGYPFEDRRDGGPQPSRGDIVRISGNMVITPNDLRRLQVRHLEILGHAPLPPPIQLTDANVDDPSVIYSFVKARGIATAVVQDDLDPRYRLLILKMRHHSIDVPVPVNLISHTRLRSLLGAEIEVSGLFTRKSGWRRNSGTHRSFRMCTYSSSRRSARRKRW